MATPSPARGVGNERQPAGFLIRALGRIVLRLGGWRLVSSAPPIDKFVCVVAPHTSNWDFVWCLFGSFAAGCPGNWLAKHTLFFWPVGALWQWLGGIPVDRSRRGELVEQVAEAFARRTRMVLVITPEGTRSYTERWKSGFYNMAHRAGVPVVLAYTDYTKRECGFGPAIPITGDRDADMAQISAFVAKVTPRYPEKAGPVRL